MMVLGTGYQRDMQDPSSRKRSGYEMVVKALMLVGYYGDSGCDRQSSRYKQQICPRMYIGFKP
ncbi:hypothetical protein ACHAWU_005198 [Discostella pseudostelligera]|uniref:Uncharacterized protein n=1 Tax=Discostella pseudostelligera TaxID=259834 RepID=A0ABD3MGM1_9STRA